jgi:hypothetical protein
MRVKFRTNLGSRDAKDLDLDHAECVADAVVDVSDEAAESLISSGVAVAADLKAAAAKAAPKPESVAEPKK